jgi:hypothetical protein
VYALATLIAMAIVVIEYTRVVTGVNLATGTDDKMLTVICECTWIRINVWSNEATGTIRNTLEFGTLPETVKVDTASNQVIGDNVECLL